MKFSIFSLNSKTQRLNVALLIIRLALGLSFIDHGYPKIMGGVEMWAKLGGVMAEVGIAFAPAFWGFMAALVEFGGGILLILGLLTRLSSTGLAFVMLMAAIKHFSTGDPFSRISHPLELLAVFVALIMLGGGRYSIDAIVRTSFLRRRR